MTQSPEIILVGWKSIASAFGINDIDTMKKIIVKYKLPVRDLNGKPAIQRLTLEKWLDDLPLKKIKV